MFRHAKRSIPSFEILEPREVPAGNVTAVVVNGNLILTGDGESNSIEIRNGVSSIRVQGLDGTDINGAPGLEDFAGYFKDVIINLKGGSDVVNLEGGGGGTAAVISRDLIFLGGGGLDTLTSVAGAVVGRDLVFAGGGGNTTATLDDIVVGRHLRISGTSDVIFNAINGGLINGLISVVSAANVEVLLDNTTLGRLRIAAASQAGVDMSGAFVGGNVNILGGSGSDLIDIGLGTDILGGLAIRTRGGNDTVDPNAQVGGSMLVHLGGGTSQELDVSNLTVHGNLTVLSTGNGIDDWTLDGVEVLGQTRLLTDGGADIVLINDAEFFGRLTLVTGAGADQVTVADGNNVTIVGIALIHLGGGDDTLQLGTGVIGQANFLFRVTLQGGLGSDTLNDVNSDFDVTPVILSF